MRVLFIIFGVLLIIAGGYCMLTPIATYSTLSWLIGLAMLVEGIGSIVTWNQRRRIGFADGWTLAGAIVSVILGCFLLGSYVAQFAVDLFIAYLIAIWLVVGGITRIVAALKMRDYNKNIGTASVDSNWGLLLAMGVIVVIAGVLCLINPISVMVSIGIMLGISIICVGVDFIVRAIRRY